MARMLWGTMGYLWVQCGSILHIMATERSNGAPWGAPVRPIRLPRGQNATMRRIAMCMKAMQRGNAVGKDLRGRIAIAMGDVPWMNRKV